MLVVAPLTSVVPQDKEGLLQPGDATAHVKATAHPGGFLLPSTKLVQPYGFTIVELVVVIILLAILSTVALSRTVSTSAFAPATVSHQLQQDLKFAQASAMARQDTQVSFQVDLDGTDWRMITSNLVDGVTHTTRLSAENTNIRLTHGALIEYLADGGSLSMTFDSSGDLATLNIEGNLVSPNSGLLLEVLGDSNRSLCLYHTGYLANGAC